MPLPSAYPLRLAPIIVVNSMCINVLSGLTDKELCHHDPLYYNVIESTDPYYTINEHDMISNFQEYICIPSSSNEFRSDVRKVRAERPFSPNLLESCRKEMKKRGLKLFDGYQNVDCAINNPTRTSSGLGNQRYGLCASQSNRLKSPPTPCKGRSMQTGHNRFVQTTAEVRNYYLEAKSVIPDEVVRNDQSSFSIVIDEDYKNSALQDSTLHMNSEHSKQLVTTKNDGFDKKRLTQSEVRNSSANCQGASSSIHYEDALSVYEVYVL